jgi:hypothetical protein
MASPKISESSVSFCNLWRSVADDQLLVDIFVPPERVIDTVDLYFLRERQRRLSLRFLSWFVLHENIQTDTHDSIEDARSALMLYTAYQDFDAQGILDEKLDELYREGRKNVRSHSHGSRSHHSHSRRTGNRQPHLGRSLLRRQCLPLLKLHHSRMSFLSCVVACHLPLLSRAVSRVAPLRDFSKVAHRAAVTGAPDEQSRLFWGPIVSVFPASRIAYCWWNSSLSVCVVITLAFYNSVVCFLFGTSASGYRKAHCVRCRMSRAKCSVFVISGSFSLSQPRIFVREQVHALVAGKLPVIA